VLLAEDAAGILGFAEVSIRPYAEGCSTDRVGYLEGWFVRPEARRRGVGRQRSSCRPAKAGPLVGDEEPGRRRVNGFEADGPNSEGTITRKRRWTVTQFKRAGIVISLGVLAAAANGGDAVARAADTKSIEEAVLAVSAEMTKAGEAVDADRLFSYMLDTDKGSIVQNGIVMTTRQGALEQVRGNLRGIARIKYTWTRQSVTVLSPAVAVLVAEGESTATTDAGQTFTTPFAQTVVFVLKPGGWKAIHAHQSSPRR
jgi:uncharacterized protein (TIGR02246 family)